jgi:membrane associated rhomboid family serine protease
VPASVGSQCLECLKSSIPPPTERIRRWNATQHRLVTLAIIVANVAVFVVAALQTGNVLGRSNIQRELALFGPAVADGEWYRLITSGFVHAGLLHLAMNMFVIWIAGSQLEPLLGRLRFSLLYLASLLAGSAGALLLSPDVFTVGASGAAFGLMGALAVGMYHRGIDIWRTGVGTIILINLLITFTVPSISIGGHVGGLLGGIAAGWPMLRIRRPGLKPTPIDLLAPVIVIGVSLAVSWYAVQ